MPKPLEKVFVKPAIAGQLVRKGLGQPYLDQDGEEVELTAYWHRRLRMLDVVECKKSRSKKSKPMEPEHDGFHTKTSSKKGEDPK
jgi:hypothetical protein